MTHLLQLLSPEIEFSAAESALGANETNYGGLIAKPLHNKMATVVTDCVFLAMAGDVAGIDKFKTGLPPDFTGSLQRGDGGRG